MERVEVSTLVYVPPPEVYEFLVDFPRYARYSEYLESVTQDGNGSAWTRYDLTFSWWKLSYTARSEVTNLDPPERIDWRLIRHIDARGYWKVTSEPESAPEGIDDASRVSFLVDFSPESADDDALDLPRFVSMERVVDAVIPKIKGEAERVVERVVADLEGEPRDVSLEVHTTPGENVGESEQPSS